jgi:uncharacterized protein
MLQKVSASFIWFTCSLMSNSPLVSAAGFEFSVDDFCQVAAKELNLSSTQIEGTVRLLEEGNTIPFIARYRKEVTKGLDERQLRAIEDMLAKAKELAARKNTILKTIAEQGKLTEALQKQIVTCMDPRVLEDLYLPYKPKKRTRAAIARERGLQPLADLLFSQQRLSGSRADIVRKFISADKDVPDEKAAIQSSKRVRRKKAASSRTTLTAARKCQRCRLIAFWPCSEAKRKAYCESAWVWMMKRITAI